MKRSVEQPHFHVFHGVPGEDTILHRFDNALFGRLDVLLGDYTADDIILELKSLALLVRFDLNLNMAELTTTAALSDEFSFSGDFLGDRLLVGNLRLADICLDPEFTFHPVHNNLEVQLTHSTDNRLPRLFI